jgi:release factor glutamine methyltransferase
MHPVIRELHERHALVVEPTTFGLYGLQWDLLPGVYAPSLSPGAALYVDWLSFTPGMRFCEVGCGTGYLSVLAAKHGCTVVALDIDSVAVENTRRNALRHGVSHRVDVRVSDLFSALLPNESFDLIFWNSSFIDVAPDEVGALPAYVLYDPGYHAHAGFVRQAGSYLADGGQLRLGFTDLGNFGKLEELAEQAGQSVRMARAALVPSQHQTMTYALMTIEGWGATS